MKEENKNPGATINTTWKVATIQFPTTGVLWLVFTIIN